MDATVAALLIAIVSCVIGGLIGFWLGKYQSVRFAKDAAANVIAVILEMMDVVILTQGNLEPTLVEIAQLEDREIALLEYLRRIDQGTWAPLPRKLSQRLVRGLQQLEEDLEASTSRRGIGLPSAAALLGQQPAEEPSMLVTLQVYKKQALYVERRRELAQLSNMASR